MIFITGGTGLLGTRLICDLLESGEKIRALKRKDSKIDTFLDITQFYALDQKLLNNLEWIEGDVCDTASLDAMEGCAQVYHCAAAVSFLKKDRDLLFKINVEGTQNMVNAALRWNIQKFCHVSSTAALGESISDGKITEESLWIKSDGRSNYAITKKAAEMEVWRAMEEGLNAVIVNPSVIIGPGKADQSSASLFSKVQKGLKYYTHGVNGFVDVRDVSAVMLQLMRSNIANERFLVIGENRSFKEVFDQIAINLNMPKPSTEAKPWMALFIWRLEALRSLLFDTEPLVSKENSESAFKKTYYSNEKVKAALLYEFIPIDKSIKDSSAYYQSMR
jgi:dihydroflavonol-4-reductase